MKVKAVNLIDATSLCSFESLHTPNSWLDVTDWEGKKLMNNKNTYNNAKKEIPVWQLRLTDRQA